MCPNPSNTQKECTLLNRVLITITCVHNLERWKLWKPCSQWQSFNRNWEMRVATQTVNIRGHHIISPLVVNSCSDFNQIFRHDLDSKWSRWVLRESSFPSTITTYWIRDPKQTQMSMWRDVVTAEISRHHCFHIRGCQGSKFSDPILNIPMHGKEKKYYLKGTRGQSEPSRSIRADRKRKRTTTLAAVLNYQLTANFEMGLASSTCQDMFRNVEFVRILHVK